MPRRLYFALCFLLLFGPAFPQEAKIPPRREIVRLNDKAADQLAGGQFEKSLAASRLVLHYATVLKDDQLIASSYNTIAGNYDELSEYDRAIDFYNKALEYVAKTNNDSLKGWINNNLGNMYFFEKEQYRKGIQYYKKSLEYSEKIADTSQQIFTKLNLAWAYFDVKQFDTGYPYLKFINENHEKFKDESIDVVWNMLNGMYAAHTGQKEKAEKFFKDAIRLGKAGKEKFDLANAYEEYSKFLLTIGNYKDAYRNLDRQQQLNDSLYDKEKLKKADQAGVDLRLDEYKRQVDRIESEKDAQSMSLRKSEIIVLLFAVILIILLLLLYTLYRNNNFRKKANSELMLANDELISANAKAEEASQLKSQFVSTISHELRTPLYGVVGLTNMILDEHKELASSPHLTSLKFSARYLLALVNDILQINKIEEKRIVLETLTFNLQDEVTTVVNSLKYLATKNSNQVVVDVDPKIPEFLIGDKLRLAQILMNLVSNALKFTKNGGVLISAKLVRTFGKINYIEFHVRDNGIGIAADDQAKIYDKFVQIGRREDDYQGTGLGLSIVKRLVELFESQISIKSKLNEGSTFSFTIGFEADLDKTREIINEIEVDLTSSQHLKTLVVEDNKINQMVTRRILEKNNFSCDIADDGLIALKMVEKITYDIILMDINMPVIDGFETTRRIRKMGITIPIVALTAFDKEEITEAAISAGMNDIIIKPFDPVKLFQIISIHVKKRNAG